MFGNRLKVCMYFLLLIKIIVFIVLGAFAGRLPVASSLVELNYKTLKPAEVIGPQNDANS